jgi:RHS repeat-associated protein
MLSDERGSVIAVTNAAGAAYAYNTYDEYGIPGASNLGRFQYTGQMYIPEIGMYHYNARAYSPTLGRFMQTDPSGFNGGMNLYAYAGDDPVNGSDPTGLTVILSGLNPSGNLNYACEVNNCIPDPNPTTGSSANGPMVIIGEPTITYRTRPIYIPSATTLCQDCEIFVGADFADFGGGANPLAAGVGLGKNFIKAAKQTNGAPQSGPPNPAQNSEKPPVNGCSGPASPVVTGLFSGGLTAAALETPEIIAGGAAIARGAEVGAVVGEIAGPEAVPVGLVIGGIVGAVVFATDAGTHSSVSHGINSSFFGCNR